PRAVQVDVGLQAHVHGGLEIEARIDEVGRQDGEVIPRRDRVREHKHAAGIGTEQQVVVVRPGGRVEDRTAGDVAPARSIGDVHLEIAGERDKTHGGVHAGRIELIDLDLKQGAGHFGDEDVPAGDRVQDRAE